MLKFGKCDGFYQENGDCLRISCKKMFCCQLELKESHVIDEDRENGAFYQDGDDKRFCFNISVSSILFFNQSSYRLSSRKILEVGLVVL